MRSLPSQALWERSSDAASIMLLPVAAAAAISIASILLLNTLSDASFVV
jgi:hypothetical protein